MSNKLQRSFREGYEDLEKICRRKCGVSEQGVLAYIERLNTSRPAPDRDEVLPKLARVYDLYQRAGAPVEIPGEQGETKRLYGLSVTREDVRFLKRLGRAIVHRSDPLSVYLRRTKRQRRWKRFLRIALPAFSLLVIAAVVLLILLR